MAHSFPEKIVKISKDRYCWGCSKKMDKGTMCLKQSGVHEGEGFWNGWYCEKCASFIKTKSSFDWFDYQEGLCQGDLKNHDDYTTHSVTPLNQLKLT